MEQKTQNVYSTFTEKGARVGHNELFCIKKILFPRIGHTPKIHMYRNKKNADEYLPLAWIENSKVLTIKYPSPNRKFAIKHHQQKLSQLMAIIETSYLCY